MSSSSSPLFILYGSATGNAEHIAKDLAAAYEKRGASRNKFSSVFVGELDQFKKKGQPVWDKECEPDCTDAGQTKHGLIIVTSTTGNGDAPENAGRFVRFVKRKTTPASQPFRNVTYAVLGLGDTNYDQFCQCGVICDKKLAECGGQRLQPIAMADEATGLEDVVEPWTASILDNMEKACFGSDSNSNSGNGCAAAATTTTSPTPTCETTTDDKNAEMTNESTKENAPATRKEPKQPEEKATTTTSSSPSFMTGVDIIRALLEEDETMEKLVDATTLPSLISSMSSCALVDQCDEPEEGGQQRPRSESIGSMSSSGIHYNAKRPFQSSILSARYLTQTSTEAVQKVTKSTTSSGGTSQQDSQDSQWWQSAHQTFDNAFPLNGEKQDDVVERNGKRVVELTLSLRNVEDDDDDAHLEHEPGDSLGLLVENPAESVQFILDMLQKQDPPQKPDQLISMDGDHPITVEQALRCEVDLCSPIKSKRLLYALSQHASDKDEQCALRLLACKAPRGLDLFDKYVDEQRRTVVDILREFPSTQSIPLTALMSMLPTSIPPRYYSVASSPLDESTTTNKKKKKGLSIAFSVVDYITPSMMVKEQDVGSRRVHGIATRHLETLASPFLCNNNSGDNGTIAASKVRIFPKPTAEFRLPMCLQTPLILIGPGTGIAPFMGFLSHRKLEKQQREATEVGPVHVLFGCRHKDHDWLYKQELQAYKNEGIVEQVYNAFSRDDPKTDRKYVQDFLLKDHSCATRLTELILHKHAAVYICGDGNKMAKDVQAAIVEMLAANATAATTANGGTTNGASTSIPKTKDEAQQYLNKMKTENRFLMDIWS